MFAFKMAHYNGNVTTPLFCSINGGILLRVYAKRPQAVFMLVNPKAECLVSPL